MTVSAGKRQLNRKKGLIFIEDGSYTYDNRVQREVNALQEYGWEITVICPKYKDDPLYKNINEKVRIYYYPKPFASSLFGHFIEHFFTLLFGTILLFWVSIKHGFHVIHGCNPIDIVWLMAIPYRIIGKKYIFDQHDLCPELYISRGDGKKTDILYRVLLTMEKLSYKYADAVIVTNESYKEIAIKRGNKDKHEVFVVRNGPDLNKFKITAKNLVVSCEPQAARIGYLGNMNQQDGVEHLLYCVDHIKNVLKRQDIKFILIGGGSQYHYLSEKSVQMGLDDCINFTGRISDQKMLSELSGCIVCVQPDPLNPLNDKSTMNKVMEYMALEKPVVTFDLKETRVTCDNAALYAKPNDVTDLAEKIVKLVDDPKLRLEMGRKGRKRVEDSLSWDYSVPKLIKAYAYVSS